MATDRLGYACAVSRFVARDTPQLRAYGDVLPAAHFGAPPLPQPRGPRSEWALSTLRRPAGACVMPPPAIDDAVTGDDSALALYLLYELHYRGLDGVDPRWEWQPELIAARGQLEHEFLTRRREGVPPAEPTRDIAAALHDRAAPADEPTLA